MRIRRRDRGEIEVAPIAFMRGRTLSHAFVIVDEAHTCARPTGASPGQQQRHDLVRRIAEENGGSVRYAAREPRGSVFTLTLPKARE